MSRVIMVTAQPKAVRGARLKVGVPLSAMGSLGVLPWKLFDLLDFKWCHLATAFFKPVCTGSLVGHFMWMAIV